MKTILEDHKEFICDIEAPCFSYLEKEEAEMIRSGRTQVQFRKGDTITKQGAFSSYILFSVRGFAKQYLEGENNKYFNIKVITPGEFIGLSSAFDQVKFDYTTVALTDFQAFLIEKDAVAGLIKKNGTFGFNIARRYCRQNSSLYDTMSALYFRQMSGRLAGVLLYLDELWTRYPELNGMLTRKDIASFCGISTENCVRELKSLESEGIIKLADKQIHLTDRKTLGLIRDRG